jgi:hypothetical protein
MLFSTATPSHTFFVQSRDNRNIWDPTPATISIDIADIRNINKFPPNTIPVTVPAAGTSTSRGVHFIINGSDLDGSVTGFQRAIDDTSAWVNVPASEILVQARVTTLELDLTPEDLTLGSHIVYVRAMDNFGNVDDSPLSISFVAVDYLRPDLSVVSGAIPNAFYFLPQGGTTTDVNTTWAGDATWYYSTLQYHYAVDDSATWSNWISESSVTLTALGPGAHKFFLEAMDQAGNMTTYITDFGVGQLLGDRGILLVNGIDWTQYAAQARAMYAANGPFGTQSIHFWDFFPDAESYYPDNIAPLFVGSGAIPGDSLGHYSSVVMIMNEYSNSGPSDLDVFNSMFPLIMSYLNGGGNILLATRFGADFVKGDLRSYGLTADNTVAFNDIGVNPSASGLVAAVTGLVDIGSIGSWSLTDLPSTTSDPSLTVLFTAPDYPGTMGGYIVEPQGKGKFAFIGGRPYRYVYTAMATDFDYILSHYFGEGGR